jgi:hypothetical protein
LPWSFTGEECPMEGALSQTNETAAPSKTITLPE